MTTFERRLADEGVNVLFHCRRTYSPRFGESAEDVPPFREFVFDFHGQAGPRAAAEFPRLLRGASRSAGLVDSY